MPCITVTYPFSGRVWSAAALKLPRISSSNRRRYISIEEIQWTNLPEPLREAPHSTSSTA
ncbi:MAG: hypothetical protein LBU37_03490 [Tannerellaceae bacterium]|nr:hypothetical protein [Tannerellaceae bacterium]